MGIIVNDGDSQPANLSNFFVAKAKAGAVKNGDMVSWQASGGTARGRVEHIMREGVLGIPKSSFSIKAEQDDPAVLIRIYKDGKETETLVGHKMSTLNKSAVQKHGGGSHDQRSHGAWAGNGYGDGKFIQDKVKAPNTNDSVRRLSEIDSELADLKEYESRVKSAKSGAEIRAIMAEYKNKKNGGGKKKDGENNISAKKTNEFVGGSYHRVDTKTTAGALDKLLGKGEEIMGDKYERKVTEQWSAEFTDKSTGKSFRAAVYDYMRYDNKGLTAEQGQKMPLLARAESHRFHIGADSKEQAQIVQDYIETESKRRYLSAAE